MLRIAEEKNKTFEERFVDVMSKLPLYSEEWTNYNPSDPGITILENLTAFEAVQAESILNISYEAKVGLLRLAGIVPGKAKSARVLISADNLNGKTVLPDGQKLFLGDMCFETNRPQEIGSFHILGIYAKREDKVSDFSYLKDPEVRVPAAIFGDHPTAGSELYFICDQLPGADREIIFQFTMEKTFRRNPLDSRASDIFSGIRWECYTADGFKEMKVRDFTGGFIIGGELRMRVPEEEPAVYEDMPTRGCCIRAVLERADYDVRPRIVNVDGFLFEAWQKDTQAACRICSRTDRIRIVNNVSDEPYFLVFGKEEKGSSYRRYLIVNKEGQEGRYCTVTQEDEGHYTVEFDEKEFGYRPGRQKDPVRIVMYSRAIMQNYHVGTVLGYDHQTLDLPMNHIVGESFSLIARRVDENGEYLYDFVRPEKAGEDQLFYHLLESDGKIIIEEAGDYLGAELYIGSLAVNRGNEGNIRAGNILKAPDYPGIVFRNCADGTGGVYRETLEQMQKRFLQDIGRVCTAVTEQDYEHLVETTPGLCIRKARAWRVNGENLVRVTLLPGSDQEHPKLSPIYRDVISKRLEARRMLTTRFELIPPEYAAVDIKATVYVKVYYNDSREQIERLLRAQVDYLHSDPNFGEVLRFEDIFRAMESLECVDYVYELSLRPQKTSLATMREADIFPKENVLLHVGRISLELVTNDQV